MNNYNLRPFRLKPKFVERVWGRRELQPWYESTGDTGLIGEAWLTGPECVIEDGENKGRTLADISQQCTGTLDGNVGGGEFPLLIKLLFPSDKLSVQVHPDDEEARALGLSRGKTECWYVLEANSGAEVACGLKPGITTEDLARGIADGSVEGMMEMLPVIAGDMVYVDAGTVHAIGPGVVLLEVQQMSDVTYRLYDYGRDRELHLTAGLAVVKTRTQAGKVKPKQTAGDTRRLTFTRLIENKHFAVDRFDVPPGFTFEMPMDGVGCVVGVKGTAAANEVKFAAGQAVIVPQGSATMSSAEGGTFLRCFEPGSGRT